VLRGKKILVTGANGQIAFPICEYLAPENDVWGVARFSDPASRARLEAAGVTARFLDLDKPDFTDIPDDFDYVLHLAAYLSPGKDYEAALRTNADGTGLVLHHCRRATAALVMTTGSVYDPNPDPWHLYRETDPLGDGHLPIIPTYSISKIAEEAVARSCSLMFELPVSIVRMNVAYGRNGGMAVYHLDSVVDGRPVPVRWDPSPYSPIFQDDVNWQIEPLLGAATTPATIINFAGDEAVSIQEWTAYFGELAGRTPQFRLDVVDGTHRGVAIDVSKRLAITGPCRTDWRTGMRLVFESRYPDGVTADTVAPKGAAHSMEQTTP
jgi:nucleoside-diphosphate-sugar epimerase